MLGKIVFKILGRLVFLFSLGAEGVYFWVNDEWMDFWRGVIIFGGDLGY
jgi:hypothetical protein